MRLGEPAPREILERIDTLDPATREREKLRILADSGYVAFAAKAFGVLESQIRGWLSELHADERFFNVFTPLLSQADSLASVGDLRFHSVTCYLAARSSATGYILETGVASGKSTTYFLLGIKHNAADETASQHLVSIDLPATGEVAADGSDTELEAREIGWLIPPSLRDRWTLMVGPSSERLPQALSRFGAPTIFLHDSLHTRANTLFELQEVLRLDFQTLIMCDNLELGSGDAFREVVASKGLHSITFGNFGVIRRAVP